VTATTPARERLRGQLLEFLPELREALRHRWTLRAVLAAHGQEPRLLTHLERLGALDVEDATRPGRWRRWRWVAEETDAELVERLLLLPHLQPSPAVPTARWRLARHPKPCTRCGATLHVTGPRPTYLHVPAHVDIRRHRYAEQRVCTACVEPAEHPRHERQLATLLEHLRTRDLLFPEEFTELADRLDVTGSALRRVAHARELRALGADLREVAGWLRTAARLVAPTLELLRAQVDLPAAVGTADHLLATVGDHPLAYPADSAEAAASKAALDRVHRAHQLRLAAYRLRDVMRTATGWVHALRDRLAYRQLLLKPTA
jgi:hypothetical protein